jgi:hypothetical protein
MPSGRKDEARAFYQHILGIPEVARPAYLAKRGGSRFEGGPLKVHPSVENDFVPARKAHPAFIVDGLRELVMALQGGGLPRLERSTTRRL